MPDLDTSKEPELPKSACMHTAEMHMSLGTLIQRCFHCTANSVVKTDDCRWAKPCGWIVVIWTAAVAILLCFPLKHPITLLNFNYTAPAMVLLVVVTSTAWCLTGQHWFQGPTPSICSSDAVKVRLVRCMFPVPIALGSRGWIPGSSSFDHLIALLSPCLVRSLHHICQSAHDAAEQDIAARIGNVALADAACSKETQPQACIMSW